MRHLAIGLLGLWILAHGAAAPAQDTAATVPLGGNAYVTRAAPANDEVVTDTGLHNWDSSRAVISTYVYVPQPGRLRVALAGALNGAGHSTVKVSVGRQSHLARLSSTAPSPFPAGDFLVDRPGYVRIDLQGVATDGGYYGDIEALQVDGPAAAGLVYANDPANFYWSRRGPSVHLGFDVPDDTEYFYSEVTVPRGQDPVGSYYMADGFNVGYFGMQVNSATERRVLFSVWDSPSGPTSLVRQGPDVTIASFGGEGTGGQSYLVYPWVAGETYRFLTRARPDGEGNTEFTAWFGPATGRCGPRRHRRDGCDWKLIATWKYAGTATYLRGVYSFLESFDPDHGYQGRSARYGNQWAVTADGHWNEVTSAYYDVDPTGLNRQRLDFAGGRQGDRFYLRNDGFFSPSVASGQTFERPASHHRPEVDLDDLP